MTTNQLCPICGFENISTEDTQCPQCDADLSCFKMLDAIPDEAAPLEKERPKLGMKIVLGAVILSMILIIAMAVFQFSRFKRFERLLADHRNSITSMDEKLQHLKIGEAGSEKSSDLEKGKRKEETRKSEIGDPDLKDGKPQHLSDGDTEPKGTPDLGRPRSGIEVSDLKDEKLQTLGEAASKESAETGSGNSKFESRIPGVEVSDLKVETQGPDPQAPRSISNGQQADAGPRLADSDFRMYTAKEDDTLWDVAEAHYGTGLYYPVLLEHNPHIGIYAIGNGVRLKILKDVRLAKDTYDRIVEKDGDNLYWNYTVVEGDTIRTVITKFYRIDVQKQLTVFNPDTQLQPGKNIKILLK